MAVMGPSTALARMAAFSAPVARSRQRRESRMVPTPMVMARAGTLAGSPPNMGAFCWRVAGVRAFSRVRDNRADRGSLKPMWPSLPRPSNCRSMPPASWIIAS